MRYLVTGATGFLGRHVALQLAEAGHDVIALARSTVRAPEHPRITPRRGDILDEASVRDAVTGCAGLYHCAGRVSREPDDAEALWRTHVVGTRTVLKAAHEAGVGRAVVASTSGTIAIGEDPDHIGREDDVAPLKLIQRFPYYRSKLYAEYEALEHNRNGLDVVIVNPTLLLGPGDVHGSSTGDVKRFLDEKIPAVPAGGVAYVDARDAAAAMRLAMERGQPGRRYLINASNCTVREFFARLERVSGVRAPVIPMTRGAVVARVGATLLGRAAKWVGAEAPVDPVSAEMGQLFWYADSSRAEKELGWRARDPIATLADTVSDLRAASRTRVVETGER